MSSHAIKSSHLRQVTTRHRLDFTTCHHVTPYHQVISSCEAIAHHRLDFARCHHVTPCHHVISSQVSHYTSSCQSTRQPEHQGRNHSTKDATRAPGTQPVEWAGQAGGAGGTEQTTKEKRNVAKVITWAIKNQIRKTGQQKKRGRTTSYRK